MRSTTNHIRVTRRPSAEKRVVNTLEPARLAGRGYIRNSPVLVSCRRFG